MKEGKLLSIGLVFFLCLTTYISDVTGQIEIGTYLNDIKRELEKEWPHNKTINLVFHGHSVPAGYFKTPHVNTLDAYPYQVLKKLKEYYPTAVINIINTSIGGENSVQGAKRFDDEVLVHRPDVLFIDYALNDRSIGVEDSKEAWKIMIKKAKEYGCKIILLTASPDLNENYFDPYSPLNLHNNMIFNLAMDYNIGIVSVDSGFGMEYFNSGNELTEYMSQSNHPNKAGHKIIASGILHYFTPPIDSIPFMYTNDKVILVDAVVNSSDTIPLMFHTAVSDISLLDETAEELLGNISAEEVTSNSWGGSGSVNMHQNIPIQIGNRKRLERTIWTSKRSGIGSKGKFGPSYFGNEIVEIDIENSRLIIHPLTRDNIIRDGYDEIPIQVNNGSISIPIKIDLNGTSITHDFLLHTGYAGGLLFDDDFASTYDLLDKIEITETSQLSDSQGNILATQKGNISTCTLYKSKLHNIPVSFFSGDINRQKFSVVGMDILERFNIILDLHQSRMWIRER